MGLPRRGNLIFRDPAAIDSSTDAEDPANMTEDEKGLTFTLAMFLWPGNDRPCSPEPPGIERELIRKLSSELCGFRSRPTCEVPG